MDLINYRKDIELLRGIAVLLVVLFHLGLSTFQGGFIGVDIFFVISGYLITSIIFKELQGTGNFSFKKFYERRIRRIMPVLLFVMLVTLPLGWMYLLPFDFVEFSKESIIIR